IEMGNVIVVIHISETKLQHLHAGEAKLIAQTFYIRRDDTEVFGEDRQDFSELFFDRGEQSVSRSLDPLAVDGGLLAGRYGPVSFKATEMVDAQIVCQGELASDAADPPLISRLFMVIPVVKRISPELACRAEVIRRHSGYG